MYNRKNRLVLLIMWLLSLLMMPAMAWAGSTSFDEGIEYQRVVPAQATLDKKKIEVLELFWYGCPHCHQLEPKLEAWIKVQKDDVNFVRLPALLNPKWEHFVRAYYVAQILGVLENIHRPLFDALHLKKRNLNNEDALARFFAEFGVSEEAFHKAYRSFGVITRVNQARKMTRRYGISGVPTIVVNGEYRTSARMAGGHDMMLKTVDYLVDRERNK